MKAQTKTIAFYFLFFFLGLSACFFSCKKIMSDERFVVTADNKQAVEAWLENLSRFVSIDGKTQVTNVKNALQFSSASIQSIKNGKRLIVVPLSADLSIHLFTEKKVDKYLTLIESDNNIITSGEIIAVGADNSNILPTASDIHELYMDNGTHFNGSVSYFSVPGKFLSQIDYQNGKEAKAMYIRSSKKWGAVVRPKTDGVKTNTEDGCIDWYWETYIDGIWVGEVYAFTTCDGGTPCALAVHISGDSNKLSVKSDCSQSAGGSGTLPPSIMKIIENLNDPCLINGWNALKNSDIKNKISDFLFGTLQMSSPFTLTINELSDIPSKPTDPPGYVVFGNNSPPTLYPGMLMDLGINLNYNSLQHGSQELVAAVIFHEVIHSYFLSQGIDITNSSQHSGMIGPYQTMMLSALQAAFPNSNADFHSLIWVGLEDFAPPGDKASIHNSIFEYTSLGANSGKGTRCL